MDVDEQHMSLDDGLTEASAEVIGPSLTSTSAPEAQPSASKNKMCVMS